MYNITRFYSEKGLVERLKKLMGLFFNEDLSALSNLDDLKNFIDNSKKEVIIPNINALKIATYMFFIRDYRYSFYAFPQDLSITIGKEAILNLYREKDKLQDIINTNSENIKIEICDCLKQMVRYSKQIVDFFETDYGYMTTLLKLSIQIFKKELP